MLAIILVACSPTRLDFPGDTPDAAAILDRPVDADVGAPVTDCVSDRECSGVGMVCNLELGRCVSCNTQRDCAGDLLCLRNTCKAVTRCTSSVTCPGQVCSPSLGYCVDCDADHDCPATQRCADSLCVDRPTPCASDRECSAMRMVCNTALAHCVACNVDVDCGAGRYCAPTNVCARQTCTPGRSVCQGEFQLSACDARGARSEVVDCPSGQRCQDGRCEAMADASADATVAADVAGATDATEATDTSGGADVAVGMDTPAELDVPTPVDALAVDLPDVAPPRDVFDGGTDLGTPTDLGGPVDAGTPPVDTGTGCGGFTTCAGRCVNLLTDAANCGACGSACTSGMACAAGHCSPSNDARASARVITLGAAETTATGTTAGATHDGPMVPCGCTSGANVWFRFTLTQREVVYLDTGGSALDTSLLITDSSGVAVPAQSFAGNNNLGLCNDDSGCGSGTDFTSSVNSRTAGVLGAGTWYVAVGGCGTGAFTLRVQHLPTTLGANFFDGRLAADSTTSSTLVGSNRIAGTCGGVASGEDVRWFVTCGARQQFFSLCASDGGSFARRTGSVSFDPAMYIRSALTGSESACNDDGGTMGGTNCRGTGDTSGAYGSRLNNVTTARGLHALIVDERSGGAGMQYTLRYIIR
ncbi:MAG: hypothetical protein Q8S73_26985 [Deltaproteobacteria bacterium]|nr:hypothetical protein [Myxococcales bacterium]MDP3217783.1 hypothetical protein [Deltaproteobacteria bacterium]